MSMVIGSVGLLWALGDAEEMAGPVMCLSCGLTLDSPSEWSAHIDDCYSLRQGKDS